MNSNNTPILHKAYIGLGSNLGNRAAFLGFGVSALTALSEGNTRCSAYYESAAHRLDEEAHPPYLNAVCEIETSLSPIELLKKLLDIEMQAGRKRKKRWESRTLDLDLLLFEDWQVEQKDLKIPHPFLYQRRFVLAPLAELIPDFILPESGLTVSEALDRCTDDEVKPYLLT